MNARCLIFIAVSMFFVAGQAFADMDLAKKSGCTACHKVEAKVVGPPWACVAKRYKGQKVKDALIEKVSKGGKGKWVGGDWGYLKAAVPMPPYHPRVSKENIGKLVDFILALDDGKCPPKG